MKIKTDKAVIIKLTMTEAKALRDFMEVFGTHETEKAGLDSSVDNVIEELHPLLDEEIERHEN